MHPRSPLSSTSLVRNVFFSEDLPTAEVKEFEHWMAPWESMKWPIFMFSQFVSFARLVQNISGWGRGSRVCVIVGAEDRIVRPPIAKTNAVLIRAAVEDPADRRKVEGLNGDDPVSFVVVKGAPHHLQNDVTKDDAAAKVLEFLKQLV